MLLIWLLNFRLSFGKIPKYLNSLTISREFQGFLCWVSSVWALLGPEYLQNILLPSLLGVTTELEGANPIVAICSWPCLTFDRLASFWKAWLLGPSKDQSEVKIEGQGYDRHFTLWNQGFVTECRVWSNNYDMNIRHKISLCDSEYCEENGSFSYFLL